MTKRRFSPPPPIQVVGLFALLRVSYAFVSSSGHSPAFRAHHVTAGQRSLVIRSRTQVCGVREIRALGIRSGSVEGAVEEETAISVREIEKEQDEQKVKGTRDGGIFTYDWENGKRVQWSASKASSLAVEEVKGMRKLREYLALPPTKYSLLDPKMITRLSDETFRMDCGTLSIVGSKVNPILFMRVIVSEEKAMANIMVEKVELDGSPAIRSAGGSFSVKSNTVVSCADFAQEEKRWGWKGGKEGATKELRTKATIDIDLLVPNENFIPIVVLQRAGTFVMQRVLDIGLPQFTRFLRRDYGRWSQGDDERGAVASEDESLIRSD
ncbi:unnamed protein product [Discosporangium mesarthrocarpum]